MTASMTAFCRSQSELPDGCLVWEIRSVNHRYLDVHLKLPEQLRALESGCREQINGKLNRGRIDATLKVEPGNSISGGFAVNEAILVSLGESLALVKARIAGAGAADPCEILRWPGVLDKPDEDVDGMIENALGVLAGALDELVEVRLREGLRLQQLISDRVTAAREIVRDLKSVLPEIEMNIRQRWQRRLDELGDEVDPSRLNQELALLLTRIDVSEELDRLDTHFDEVERVLSGNRPAGRRLEFIMQELNREANTLGAKSADLRNTSAAVELKVLIDQMREQVQNVE
jgi:uncharacterized protein (TIGR00255 family)